MPTMPWVLLRWAFFIQIESTTYFLILVSHAVFAFRFQFGCHVQLLAQLWQFTPLQPLKYTYDRPMCFLVMVWPTLTASHRVGRGFLFCVLFHPSHMVCRVFHSWVTHLPWVHGQDVNTNPITWTRVWGLLYFEHELDSIFNDSQITRTGCILWWASYHAFFSLFRVPVLSTLSKNSKLELFSSTKSCKMWCQATGLLVPLPLVGEMSASKLICSFPFIQWHLGCKFLHHKITSFWTLPIRGLISLISRLVLVQLLMPLWIQNSVFLMPKLHISIPLPHHRGLMDGLFQFQTNWDYWLEIYDILDSAVSKQCGTTACNLAYLFFNSAFKQHLKVWTVSLHNFLDIVPPS